ncbi:uracil phosphoribosyltransferase [Candidatus Methylacidiphilum fumarolicum]|uniref:Uracil phosphoribosyltransferase n=2 Tax=Candidatus Methylacidiphilum fumarolicum TaxID=591154 RepID=I0JWD0_METFB|nr:uracil phosphoribosyltransferase [Candidatus Methylacidiphilum fumarolicum]MBW6415584.1 uracil phosphoribosyltransferase [Candidatus Methylacidiphilum fumarolicum]TFE66653.1 uracil phosphoribosyltransferase [Candidatus Methylacidiphilum fumarolicum]TFE73359.1 uracil phosphoribosyltransferase [Candidatus Methylacidiphilum fumarolicum]TFE75442.1 uracil phosphoribosyltransferase [Candidatus Methylacidiphilum fumarolicum]TFE76665.1 uracil phosphoribosyltransferase [Candidatus Methylacidiphilum 
MSLQIIEHPLLIDRLTRLRDRKTPKSLFGLYMDQVSSILATFATKSLSLEPTEIETPLEKTSTFIFGQEIILTPILRAGLGMLKSFQSLIPESQVFFLGAVRNEKTLESTLYHGPIPSIKPHHHIFILDPMIATGHTMIKTIKFLKDCGAISIRVVCCIASPEGIKRIQQTFDDVEIIAGCVDREINPSGFILPGLGDAGDRLFGLFEESSVPKGPP